MKGVGQPAEGFKQSLKHNLDVLWTSRNTKQKREQPAMVAPFSFFQESAFRTCHVRVVRQSPNLRLHH